MQFARIDTDKRCLATFGSSPMSSKLCGSEVDGTNCNLVEVDTPSGPISSLNWVFGLGDVVVKIVVVGRGSDVPGQFGRD